MLFGKHILKYREEILKDLKELISIPSCAVCDFKNTKNPYGKQCRIALDWILKKGEDFGFLTKNIDGYAGHCEYGNGKDYCAVLSHIDVVPAGENWSSDPFVLTQKEKRLFARGVVDDKGPALASLYCLKVLKDLKILGKRRIRVIFGSGEECGMEDMRVYFSCENFPDMAFTPDSQYGICNREKGILNFELTSKFSESRIKKFQSGTVANAVPGSAFAILDVSEKEFCEILNLAKNLSLSFEHRKLKNFFEIKVLGVSAHASCPEKGKNASLLLLNLLYEFFKDNSEFWKEKQLHRFLIELVGFEINGNSLSISCSDSESGKLTLNVGVLDIENSQITTKIDIRYPVTYNSESIVNVIKEKAKEFNSTFSLNVDSRPINVESNSLLVKTLSDAYYAVIGEKPLILSSSGGSYARVLEGRGVSFGPVFPFEETNIHNADESIDTEKFFLHSQICLEAMKRMMEA
ncbi:MAG: Sapep family Mn(2+)-dependent dipeptidase [Oscillospiraceae bacterium]|jgi:succinyl-diaminopimelate desuccinylase|nr:Sapep family Mn(2+)-dependent dipeptidase [Oscillospiraceae bacterium]